MATVYERAFWAAAGILVMTGVGNAAAFGISLASPASAWGAAFMTKLALVLVLLALSVPRTVAVVQLGSVPDAPRTRAGGLATLYGATTLVLLAILAVAVWLAHG